MGGLPKKDGNRGLDQDLPGRVWGGALRGWAWLGLARHGLARQGEEDMMNLTKCLTICGSRDTWHTLLTPTCKALRRPVCKTFIRRFDSDPRLQLNPFQSYSLEQVTPASSFGVNRTKTAKSGRRQRFCQTLSLTKTPFCQAGPYFRSALFQLSPGLRP